MPTVQSVASAFTHRLLAPRDDAAQVPSSVGLLDSPKYLHIWYTKKKDKVGCKFGRRVRTFWGVLCVGLSRDVRIFIVWVANVVDACQPHCAGSSAR